MRGDFEMEFRTRFLEISEFLTLYMYIVKNLLNVIYTLSRFFTKRISCDAKVAFQLKIFSN